MRKLEKIIILIILVALIMKFTFIMGGDVLLTLSISFLSIIYYPFGFAFLNQISLRKVLKKDSYKDNRRPRIIGAIGVGIGLSTVTLGMLFKIQHWPGATINLLIGLTILAITFLVSLLKYIRYRDPFYTFMFRRIIIFGALGAVLFFLPDFTLEKIQYRNYPNYIKAIDQYLENPNDPELKQKMELEYNKITMTKEEFKIYQKINGQ